MARLGEHCLETSFTEHTLTDSFPTPGL